ncbi:MAG: energy-coupling factor transporter ATPase [Lachnospiraceae bacterium]|nr:energy-coupling factor transporter ATPase [Lachnospiraceae bacterium]
MAIVKAEDLQHVYAELDDDGKVTSSIVALSDIDLEVEPGQFIGILGHNGSGKSTFAKHINALLTPTGGTMYVEGMDTRDEEKTLDIRQTAGMVFQNPDNQIIASVVEEDVGFGPENMGVPSDEIWKRVNDALEATGMTAYREHSPNKLSGGQKQRVAIAGVMAMRPKCIIMDEPTAMLDPVGRIEVLDAVKKLNKEEKVTVIHITHYMNEVTDADYLYVMDKGRIALKGRPAEVFSQVEKMKEIGLDVPQVTELAYELRKEGLDIPADILTIDEMVEAICRLR